jgi:PAT family beta-lactamase induction signal transducer AmpG
MRAYGHRKVVVMLFLGFSAGLPLMLIFSTLSIWLREAEVSRSMVTYFSWAALGYSFKFVWAPIVDKMPLPWLTRWLGPRRSWLLVAQCAVIFAICWMAMIDPAADLGGMAMAAVMLGFSSATQDIVVDAYRIECVGREMRAPLASSYQAGYRIGMIVAGAGGLKLAAWFGGDSAYSYQAWQSTYLWMAAIMVVGIVTTLVIREPQQQQRESAYLNSLSHYVRFLLLFLIAISVFVAVFLNTAPYVVWVKGQFPEFADNQPLVGFLAEAVRLLSALMVAWVAARLAIAVGVTPRQVLQETYIAPIANFFQRYGRLALLILALIGFYRVSDIVLGIISNVFYKDMGFTKDEIANITKIFGVVMTILGGFLGGGLALRYGVMRILFVGALLSAGTNLLFLLLAQSGADIPLLVLVIAADNLSAGLASAAFVAYLSGLTHFSFTASQYALFSSLMSLFPKLLGGYSGSIVDAVGYDTFFTLTALMGLPVLLLIYLAARYIPAAEGD